MPVRALYEAIPEAVLAGPPDAGDRRVSGVTHDSRRVGPGDLFCAVPGATADGHDHVDEAVARGATAVLAERPLPQDIAQLVVPHTRVAMGPVAAAFHGRPSSRMQVVGVTGTNGKTTVVHVLTQVLDRLGVAAAAIGTLTGVRTTPEAPDLQARLAALADDGTDAVAMEVSSHALAQHRTTGTEFALGVFTNLGQDHLDYHGTMAAYFDAKAALFTSCERALVNRDDPWGRRLLDRLEVPASTYSTADLEAVDLAADGTRFTWRGLPVTSALVGRYNLSNVLAAAEAAVDLGHEPEAVAGAVAAATPVPGRLEPVDRGQGFLVVVDYAHTPDGLGALLEAVADLTEGRITVVFGCGGDRDAGKRPLMGSAAVAGADRVVVTSDNPRSEDPAAIIDQIVAGVPSGAVEVVPDRADAIRLAVAGAGEGDAVVIAGKGHETEQVGADGPVPFDDRVVAAAALEDLPVKTLLVAAAVALGLSLVGTRYLIKLLIRRQIGQPIREDGPEGHATKAGTPTMGGIAIVAGVVAGYVVSDLSPSRIITNSGLVAMAAIVGAGGVGLLDDWIKVVKERNLGLNKRAKILGLLVVAIGFAVLAIEHTPVHTTLSFTRYDSLDIDLGTGGWIVFAVLLMLGTTNAVNLTDGLDGLAAGSAIFAFSAFVFIDFWAFRNPALYDIEHALDLAVVAAAMAGGCIGFLWWNATPARIFMGDTGSLAIGAALAALSLMSGTALLLPIIGGLFVMETVTVIIQVGSFRIFGRRVFRMAPIHHHFELMGWPETTVIVRFWILSGLATALGIGLFYADFLSTGAA